MTKVFGKILLFVMMALSLSLGSCKYEPKSESFKSKKAKELSTNDIALDKAIGDMEAACKSKNRDAALAAYETILRLTLDKTIKKSNEYMLGERVLTEEQEQRLDALSDCDCISNEDIQKITEKVEAEY